ncbi:hypothetical protein ACEPPN_019344 [Leptodophora sp. 'Broadleaf-Isolate-01']
MIPLRIYKHKKMSTANEITVLVYYKTPEDEDASKSEDKSNQGKGKRNSKGKSKADKARDTVRPTPLAREISGINDLGSDPFLDYSDGEPLASPTLRDSVTQRDCKTSYMPKLSEKRKSDQATVETTTKVNQGSSSIDKLI